MAEETEKLHIARECASDPDAPPPTCIISEDICEAAGIRYEDAFFDGEAMARAALALSRRDHDPLCRLPFSVSVEAEQYGAKLTLNEKTRIPAVKNFPYKSLQDMPALQPLDFTKGQISAVLEAVKWLKHHGETVLLELEGVFSVLSLLVSSREVYKAVYRNPEEIKQRGAELAERIAEYAGEAVCCGADILSYSDATISFELVSPELYRDVCGEVTVDAVRRVRRAAPHTMLQLCSATSVGLERADRAVAEKVPVTPGLLYGEALKLVGLNRKDCRLVGHGCQVRSPLRMQEPYIYKLTLR